MNNNWISTLDQNCKPHSPLNIEFVELDNVKSSNFSLLTLTKKTKRLRKLLWMSRANLASNLRSWAERLCLNILRFTFDQFRNQWSVTSIHMKETICHTSKSSSSNLRKIDDRSSANMGARCELTYPRNPSWLQDGSLPCCSQPLFPGINQVPLSSYFPNRLYLTLVVLSAHSCPTILGWQQDICLGLALLRSVIRGNHRQDSAK